MGEKIKQQGLAEQDGHSYDVFTLEASAKHPERKFYFNIDMPHRVLAKAIRGSLDRPKRDDRKE